MNSSRLRTFLKGCLEEDLDGRGDITTDMLFSSNDTVKGKYTVKDSGVIAGLDIVKQLFDTLNPSIEFVSSVSDGRSVCADDTAATVQGPVKDLLACERLSLNILQRLSGIATRVRKYVRAVEGTGAIIMDTRKTTPGMRELEKYAVRAGGGTNHRMGLFDQVLVKDTHLGYLSRKGEALSVSRLRQKAGKDMIIEIEARNMEQVRTILSEQAPDILMLDNMTPGRIAEAVDYIRKKAPGTTIEASGGISFETVRAVAQTGVDRISVGEITHSVTALDIGFYI